MENEQKKQKAKPSYEELEALCIDLHKQLNERTRVDELREMVAICIELLKYADVLPKETFKKVTDFIDKIVPVQKEQDKDE